MIDFSIKRNCCFRLVQLATQDQLKFRTVLEAAHETVNIYRSFIIRIKNMGKGKKMTVELVCIGVQLGTWWERDHPLSRYTRHIYCSLRARGQFFESFEYVLNWGTLPKG